MTAAATDTILHNARLVLPDAVIGRGWVAIAGGRIEALGEGAPPEAGLDLDGDTLIPGLVELHTDHLESHYAPRPGVRWHPFAAVMAYDAQIAAAGITTVFDSLRVGTDADSGSLGHEIWTLADAIAKAREKGHLRVDHRTHLRCETTSADVIDTAEEFVARHAAHLISLMDHTPGQRQFRDIPTWRRYYGGKSTMSEADLDALIDQRVEAQATIGLRNRARLVEIAAARGIALASHDDTTVEDVAQSGADGVSIAEFPTTAEAAEACRAAGIHVMMGAPNVIRGGSHSGNVAAAELARAGLLDILSSDYVPASLLMAAFALPEQAGGIDLAAAVRTVTLAPARSVGLDDRGAIAAGLRADLVRVHLGEAAPVVRRIWRAGEMVA